MKYFREILLVRHDIRGNNQPFPVWDPSWALNKGDEQNIQFSRMDELNSFVGKDGVFHFR